MNESFATPERQYRWRLENGVAYRGRAVNIRLLKCERCGDRPDPSLVAKTLTLCLRCLYAYSAKVRELEAAEALNRCAICTAVVETQECTNCGQSVCPTCSEATTWYPDWSPCVCRECLAGNADNASMAW